MEKGELFMNDSRDSKNKKALIVCACIVFIGAVCAICVALGVKKGNSLVRAKDLMQGVSKGDVSLSISVNEYSKEIMDFGVKLLRECDKTSGAEENILVSPLSVLLALSMTANGAENETLTQMENVLGLKTDDLNDFSYAYLNCLSRRVSLNGTLNIEKPELNGEWDEVTGEIFMIDKLENNGLINGKGTLDLNGQYYDTYYSGSGKARVRA